MAGLQLLIAEGFVIMRLYNSELSLPQPAMGNGPQILDIAISAFHSIRRPSLPQFRGTPHPVSCLQVVNVVVEIGIKVAVAFNWVKETDVFTR
jgi:hypothetical protein